MTKGYNIVCEVIQLKQGKINMINFIRGDATEPIGEDFKYIIHCCNNIGAWGAGFVLSLSKKWPSCKNDYFKWFINGKGLDTTGNFELGEVQFSRVEYDIIVCNMIGQHGVRTRHNSSPIRYYAIEKCLQKVLQEIEQRKKTGYNMLGQSPPIFPKIFSIHCPKFGCGLAGGKWGDIEMILYKVFNHTEIPIFVYDL